ncbi:hypothetical protein V8J82_14000 [Gymnodinialimonas sp. 2305UL16-5]|uniref:hypothetical protein n=1 Tax=Gymnodinialimonas mytili TaxID=3126503 RepID=UPI0030AF64DE
MNYNALTTWITILIFGSTLALSAQVLGVGARAGDNGIAISGSVDGNVVNGDLIDCSLGLEAATIENSVVSFHSTNCEGPQGLNVQYYWMDFDAAAIVLSGSVPPELRDLFGTDPFVGDTETWREAQSVLSRYGTVWHNRGAVVRPDDPGRFVPDGLALTLLARSETRQLVFEDLVNRLTESGAELPFVRYMPMNPFPWPDLETIGRFTDGTVWPSADYTYVWPRSVGELRELLIRDENWAPANETTLSCVVPYRFISEETFRDYWNILDRASAAFEVDRVSGYRFLPMTGAYASFDPYSENAGVGSIRAGHPSYDALAHFARYNWPTDYLLATGSYYTSNLCWGTPGGFTLNALPRTPFLLIAVLSPQDEEVSITRLGMLRDPGPELRTSTRYSEDVDLNFSSQLRVSRDRPLLIPLRIDLRYDLNAEPYASITGANDGPDQIRETLQRFAPDPLIVNHSPHWQIIRQLNDLPLPTGTPITRSYVFGPSLAIQTVQTDQSSFAVAEPPASALVSRGFVMGGSCPFVSFYDEAGNRLEWRRVLVGASAPELAMREELEIPEGTHIIRIEEIEPEISFLTEIGLHGAQGSEVLVQDQALRPGEGLEIVVPEGFQRLSIEGFYELL